MYGLSLCAGVGAMDLGITLALGRYRTVGYVERDAFAAAVLVARMAEAALDPAPVWDDLTTFDGKPYCGRVDLVSSGLPCQPYSVAGRGLGHADERALWPHFVRIVRECGPSLIFIENVPPFAKQFEPVWRELRELGFVWAPPLFQTAHEAGAPHKRERFYALAAHPDRPGLEGWRLRGRERADECAAGTMDRTAPDPDHERREGEWCGWVFDRERQTLWHDADGLRCGCRIRGSYWDAESPPVRVDARTTGRVDELRALGNVGAPPVVYARALLTLLAALNP